MPQALGALALTLFQLGGPVWLSNALVGVAGFLGTGLGSALLAAGSIGLQYLLRQRPATPQPSDIQTNIRQEVAPRRRIYGRTLTGSVIVFGFRRGEKSYILHYICEGPIGGYAGFQLNKKPVTLDVNGFVTDDQYVVNGRSRVQILTTLGTMSDGPFSALTTAFPELNTPLTPFRHRGCAMVLQIVEQVSAEDMQDVYPNNMPALTALVDGYAQTYDPRSSTSGVSDNAGLVALAEIMNIYGLTSADVDEIDFSSFAAFANHSDEAVALKAGGTEKRYRAAGVITLDAENEDRIKAVAGVCNADIYLDRQGRWAIRQKMRSTPSIALRHKNGDLLDIDLQGGRGLQSKFNTAAVTYVDPALNYKVSEVRWRHAGLIADDGEEYVSPISALLCPSPTQAQRIGKLAVHEANPEFQGSMQSGPQALELLDDYCYTLDLAPEDAFERVANAVGAIEYDGESMVVSTGVVVYRADANDWTPAVDEQVTIVVPPDLPSQVDNVLLTVTVTVDVLSNSAPILRFSWVGAGGATLPDSYVQQVQVALTGTTDWTDAVVNQATDTAQVGPVSDGEAYDWRIRNVANGDKFDWQYSTAPVGVTVDAVAPKALAGFAAATVGPYLGGVALTVTTQNDKHLSKVKIFRKASGAGLNLASDVAIAEIYVGSQSTYSYADGDLTRVNLLSNGDFDSDTVWTKGGGWTISGGVASHASGSAGALTQALTLSSGVSYRYGFSIPSMVVASLRARLEGSTVVNGVLAGSAGSYRGSVTANSSSTGLGFNASSTVVCSVDAVSFYAETPACAPQGAWDYYAVPYNISDVAGPVSGPLAITII